MIPPEKKPPSKHLKGTDGENVLKRMLEASSWDVHQARRSGGRFGGRFYSRSNDIWTCIDLACVHERHGLWMIQATTSAQMSNRRRKVELVTWPLWMTGLRVSVVEFRAEPDPANARWTQHFALIHDHVFAEDGTTRTWSRGWRLEIPRRFLKAPPKKAKKGSQKEDDADEQLP